MFQEPSNLTAVKYSSLLVHGSRNFIGRLLLSDFQQGHAEMHLSPLPETLEWEQMTGGTELESLSLSF